ncbi:hypothetical protein BSI_11690 [Bacillus inaquosorum KCTC 13429]|uniref:Uncharacterized protein n=1 Tax=Bacillus inaquosorum KCTC 13429 TaxID=1236548 RepID=A0A9W5PDX7_9BACI|nr:hypothetical protein BSI_11690 [Bacillus inaquosorum KCTC 13429]
MLEIQDFLTEDILSFNEGLELIEKDTNLFWYLFFAKTFFLGYA